MNTDTGESLRAKREARGIKAYELAAVMGVHSSRVSQIEALAAVTDRTASRYLAALDSIASPSPLANTTARAS